MYWTGQILANDQPLLWALNKAIIIDLDILNDTVNIKSLTKHEPIPLAIVVLQLLSDKIVKHTSEAWLTEELRPHVLLSDAVQNHYLEQCAKMHNSNRFQ